MHWSRLYKVLTELIAEIELGILLYLVKQYTHTLTGPLDVTARGVVPALDHGRHADDELIVHRLYVLCLGLDLIGELHVEGVDQVYVLLLFCIVGDKELISSLPLAVVQEVYGNKVDITVLCIDVVLILIRILLKGIDPAKSHLAELRIPCNGAVYRKHIKTREILLGCVVTA